MHILRYLVSKSFRRRFDSKYTKELCDKFISEEKQRKDICESIFGKNANL